MERARYPTNKRLLQFLLHTGPVCYLVITKLPRPSGPRAPIMIIGLDYFGIDGVYPIALRPGLAPWFFHTDGFSGPGRRNLVLDSGQRACLNLGENMKTTFPMIHDTTAHLITIVGKSIQY